MSSTISTINPSNSGLHPQSLLTLIKAVADAAIVDIEALQASLVRYVRGVVTANVASLSAFTVAGNDGLTYVEGERVLLAKQTTASQNGIYVVGAVAGGTAALTRATDFASGAAVKNGCVVEVSEGTLWAGSSWKAMCTGSKVVGTDDPLFYPRSIHRTIALVSGTKALGAGDDIWLFSTTKSQVNITANTYNTGTLTVMYGAPVASRTAGKGATGAVTINAQQSDGTTNTADVGTVDLLITNW